MGKMGKNEKGEVENEKMKKKKTYCSQRGPNVCGIKRGA